MVDIEKYDKNEEKKNRVPHLFLRKQWYKVVESVFMKENNSRENKVEFRHCEKATKFEKNLPLFLTFT